MGVEERQRAIKLMEKAKENSGFIKEIGIEVSLKNKKEQPRISKR